MWGETVDSSDLEQTVWPRLGAIAEKLWSPRKATGDAAAALPRLEEFRCKVLNGRGIAAAPVQNTDARSAPPKPGACRTQRAGASAAGASAAGGGVPPEWAWAGPRPAALRAS